MIRVQDNPERIESTEEKTGPRLEGDKTGQAQEAFHFLLFFLSLPVLNPSPPFLLPSRRRERESSGVIQPQALEPRRLNNAPSPGPSFRRDNFAQIEHPCTTWGRLANQLQPGNLLLINARPYLLIRNGCYVLLDFCSSAQGQKRMTSIRTLSISDASLINVLSALRLCII